MQTVWIKLSRPWIPSADCLNQAVTTMDPKCRLWIKPSRPRVLSANWIRRHETHHRHRSQCSLEAVTTIGPKYRLFKIIVLKSGLLESNTYVQTVWKHDNSRDMSHLDRTTPDQQQQVQQTVQFFGVFLFVLFCNYVRSSVLIYMIWFILACIAT